MCKSLADTLRWYRDEVYKLASINSESPLLMEVISNLVDDEGNRAQDGLDAIKYGKTNTYFLNNAIENIIASIELSSEDNPQSKLYKDQALSILKELHEVYSSIASTPLLAIRSGCDEVISNVTNELVGFYSKNIVDATEVTCEFNHKFLALPDHPTIDGIVCCPHCLKQAFINK